MAWLNQQGQPVAMKPMTLQIDVPSEQAAGDVLTAANWGAVLSATIRFVIAMMTGNPTAIAAAIQALIDAIMGK